LLGIVALMSLSSPLAFLLVAVWGYVAFPSVAGYIRARSRADGGGTNRNAFREEETDYWRTKLK
jgi:hypothetical protein